MVTHYRLLRVEPQQDVRGSNGSAQVRRAGATQVRHAAVKSANPGKSGGGPRQDRAPTLVRRAAEPSKNQESNQERATLSSARDLAGFDQFWELYPRKVGQGQARQAWAGAVRKAPARQILDALEAATFDANPRFVPYPATWLTGERWTDEVEEFDPVLRAAGLKPSDFVRGERLLQ